MPVYEYECQKCGGRFEELQRFSDPPVARHQGCGGRVKRLLSAPAIQFKGSGWYITDYARKSGASGETKKEKTETKSSGNGSGKSESIQSESKASETSKKD
jgi:putative FmdB family regulatory protein